MTIQQLEYIVALDNHRNFVKAAEACFVTQPTLTMMVKKLEDETGFLIFDRAKKPLSPTPMGKQVIERARVILNEIKLLKESVSKENELLEGTFTIGIIPTLAPYLLPRFLPAFIHAYPKIHLKIRELQTEEILNALKKDVIDIGIVVTPLMERTIREIPLFNEPFMVYLPKDHRLTHRKDLSAADIQSENILIMEEGHCFREQALAICHSRKQRRNVPFEYESGSVESMKELVKQGMGITLVPELSVLSESGEHVKRFKQPEPVREVSLVVHNTFNREALLEVIHESVLDCLPKKIKGLTKVKRVKWR